MNSERLARNVPGIRILFFVNPAMRGN